MSIINKMLQDLDRRQGMSDPDATLVQQVRIVPSPRKDREWFWRAIAVLMIFAVGWVGWIAWQLQPREPVATELAFKAAQEAQRNRTPTQAAAVNKRIVQAPAEQKSAAEKAAPALKPQTPAPQTAETSKPAQGIETPVRARERKPAAKAQAAAAAHSGAASAPVEKTVAAPVPAAKLGAVAADPARLRLDPPPARILQAPAQSQGPARVEKRDRVRTPEDRAESEFRRGAALLNQGRAGEAEDAFGLALVGYPAHEAARQAMVAISLEQGRIDEARRLLREGVALNPGNSRFAFVLARIYVERRDYAAALEVMNGVTMTEAGNPELQSMRGTVLQKLGRHADAADAFQMSLRGSPQNGAVWMGFAISLESAGKNAEAAEAFRRAAATETLSAEVRVYAEQRARQLQ